MNTNLKKEHYYKGLAYSTMGIKGRCSCGWKSIWCHNEVDPLTWWAKHKVAEMKKEEQNEIS
jgi:hypothetical protein